VSDSGAVVRDFLGAWTDPKADELRRFLNDDAVWIDGPQGVRRGADVIVDELTRQLSISTPMTMEIATLVADGRTVMVEWHGGWTMGGKPISTTVMAVFEVDANGRINQMRESYDLKSVTDQIEAAGYSIPG
jgi:limonene-1,2-epoxide hydrolase